MAVWRQRSTTIKNIALEPQTVEPNDGGNNLSYITVVTIDGQGYIAVHTYKGSLAESWPWSGELECCKEVAWRQCSPY
eukprot:577926-Pelagomonas_calceolata.AAC.11